MFYKLVFPRFNKSFFFLFPEIVSPPSVCLFPRGRPSIKGVEGISFLLFRGRRRGKGETGEGKGQKAERRGGGGGGGHRRLLLLLTLTLQGPFSPKSRRGQRDKIALFEENYFCRKSTFAPLTFAPKSFFRTLVLICLGQQAL